MSASAGPDIITDGLALCLDAGNRDSYPGSGTVWRDLAGRGLNGTLTNGPTFDNENGGSIVFDGSDDHIIIPNQSRGALSCQLWLKKNNANTDPGNDRLVMSVDSLGWGIGIDSDNTVFLTEVGESDTKSNGVINDTSWHQVCVTYSGSEACFYIDGGLDVCNFYGAQFNGEGDYTIGSRGDNEFLDGNIAYILIYDRALTPQEVLQNYNATKSRFFL